MIGTKHQWWQRINLLLGGFALGLLYYEPIPAGILLVAVSISEVIEALTNKRDVSGWRLQ
jgi:hypothetical protein